MREHSRLFITTMSHHLKIYYSCIHNRNIFLFFEIFFLFLYLHEIQYNQNKILYIYIYIYIYIYTYTYVIKWNEWKRKNPPLPSSRPLHNPSQYHLIFIPPSLSLQVHIKLILKGFIFYSVPFLSKSFTCIPIICSYSFFLIFDFTNFI